MESIPPHPVPFVQPSTLHHESTIILLHGTSQDGPTFASDLLEYPIPASDNTKKTLPLLFPSTRFVFPTGSKRYSTVLGRGSHAWFDFESFHDRTQNEEIQKEGLRESCEYLKGLIEEEVDVLVRQMSAQNGGTAGLQTGTRTRGDARRRIIIGGFSQGSAMACIALLTGQLGCYEEQIGGFVGMSGWCPFRVQILDAITRSDEEPSEDHKYKSATKYLRNLLGLEPVDEKTLGVEEVPVFLGHGQDDLKMKVHWGMEMGDLLDLMVFDVKFKAYEGLAHWWNEEEGKDLVGFLTKILEFDRPKKF